ncbi:6018_t:CDS:1, partial [Scutellospora calospora]
MSQKTNSLRDIVLSEKIYNFNGFEEIKNNRERRVMIEREYNKIWKSLAFYVFGRSGTGKTSFVEKLFGKELYNKSNLTKSGNIGNI